MLILLLILTLLSPIKVNAAEIIVDENSWHTVEESEPEQPDLSDDLEYYNGNVAEYKFVDGQMRRVLNRKTRSFSSQPIDGISYECEIDGVTHYYLSASNVDAGTDEYDDGIIHYPIGYKILTPHYCQNEYSGDWLDIRYYQWDNGLTAVCLMPEYSLNWSCYQNMNNIDVDVDNITMLLFFHLDSQFRIEQDGVNYPLFRNCSAEYIGIEGGCYDLPDYAFEGCKNLTEVYAPFTKVFSNSCFENCTILNEVDAQRVTYVGNKCFKHDSTLNTLTLGQLTYVGSEAFYNCPLIGTTNLNPMPDITQVDAIGANAFWLPEDTVIAGEIAPIVQKGVKTYFADGTALRKAFDYDWAGDNRCIYWHSKEPRIVHSNYKADTVLEPDSLYVKHITVFCEGKFLEYTSSNSWKLISGATYTCDRYDCDIECSTKDDGSYILHVSGEVPGDQHNCVFEIDLPVSISNCSHDNTHVETTAWCCEGGVESVICDDCNNVISRKDVPAMGHEYPDEWTVTKPATDTECGIREKVCLHGNRCDQRACDDRPNTIRESIPLIGSDMIYKPAKRTTTDTTMDAAVLESMVDSVSSVKLCDFNPSYKEVDTFEWEFTINGETFSSNDSIATDIARSVSNNIIIEMVFNNKYCFFIETDYSYDDTVALGRAYRLPNYGGTIHESANTCIFFVRKQLAHAYSHDNANRGRLHLPPNCKNVLIMTDADFCTDSFMNETIENVYIPNATKAHAIPNACFYSCGQLKNIYINTHDFSEIGRSGLISAHNLTYLDTTHVKYLGYEALCQVGDISCYDRIELPEIEILSNSSITSTKITDLVLSDSLMETPYWCLASNYQLVTITPSLTSLISAQPYSVYSLYVLEQFNAPNIEVGKYCAFGYDHVLGNIDHPITFGEKLRYIENGCFTRGEFAKTYVDGEVSDTFAEHNWKGSNRAIEWCDDVRPVLVNDPFFYGTEEAESSVQHVNVHCTGARIVDHKQVVGIPISTVIDDGSYTLTADTEDNIDYTLTATGDLHDHDYTATGLTTKVADWTTNALEVHPNPITGPEDDVVSEYMEDAIVTCHIEALDGTNEDKGVAIPVQGLTGAATPIQYGEHVQEFEYNGVKATVTVIGTCIHRETEDVTTPSKCVGKGKVETTCKQCGEVIATKDIDPVGHDMPDVWTVIQEPTVDVFGLKVKVCQRGDDCDERTADDAPFTLYEVIPKLDKPAEEKLVKILINPNDITCDEGDKLIDHVKKVILVYEVTEPDGTKHERREEVLPSDIPGLDKELATYGRDTLDITIGDITGSAKVTVNCLHKRTEITSTEATCTHGGFTNMICAQCGYDFHVDEAVAPLGHDIPDEWTTVKIPTDTEKGLKKKVCKRGDACDERMDDGSPYTIFEDIPMLNDMTHTVHYYGEWEVVKEATCTADGLKEKKCDGPTCDNVLQESIQKLGHDMADGVHIVQDDKGYTLHKCKRNDYEYKIPDITVKVKLKSDDSSKTKGKKVTLAGKEETTNDSGEATFTLVPEGSQELEVADAGTVKFNVTKDGAKNIKKKSKNDATISTSFKDETLTVNVNLDKKKEEKKEDEKKKEESSQTQTSSSVQQKQEQPVANLNDMLNWIQNATGLPSVLPQTGQDNVSGNDKQVIIGGLPVNKSTLLFGVVILCGVVIFLIKRKR